MKNQTKQDQILEELRALREYMETAVITIGKVNSKLAKYCHYHGILKDVENK